jgi:hypothetical protein
MSLLNFRALFSDPITVNPHPRFNFLARVTPIVGLFVALTLAFGAGDPPRRVSKARTAYEVWTEMTRSSLTFEPIEFQVSPTAGAVSFGGEKEGGDALITRIMSPTVEDFEIILGTLRKDKRQEFLADFLNGLSRGRYQVDGPIVNMKGESVPLPALPEAKQYGGMGLSELEAAFRAWSSQTLDRPFAFLSAKAKIAIFDGDFAGMGGKDWIDRAMKAYPRIFDPSRSTDPVPTHFNKWKPIFGEPEKYVSRMVTELLGDWELNFTPQTTYGEFEKMMHWFRNALKDEEGLYNAFGHQWIVLPKKPISGPARRALVRNRLAEVYKVTQALIAIRGTEMQSGIQTSMYNEIRSDEMLKTHVTERSVLRLKDGLFKSNTGSDALNIEQRSGTSYNPTRRTVHKAIISRYASDDWSGLLPAGSYTLVPDDASKITENLERRFDVSSFEAKRCLERIKSIAFEGDEETVQGLRLTSLVPFWNWDGVPYISATKKALVKQITKNFIQQIAAAPSTKASEEAVLEAFARWSAITDLDTDLENYVRPKPVLSGKTGFGRLARKRTTQAFDPNKMEFGIEYTARFPVRAASTFTEEPLKHGKKAFLQLEYDLTPDEKRVIIREIAEKLAYRLNGRKVEPKRVDSAGHGHKIAITYEVPTPNGQSWRVEWDGIGRDYDLDGNVLIGSERGGVVEVVTPKMNPDPKSVRALYEVFGEMGMHPSFENGGGHVNFDLAVFDSKPREFARFIALFLENRDVITTMFQHPGRFSTAEPHDVDDAFLNKLKNFDGTDEQLKQLLYNERFFNTRLGRKTKYVQLELSSYFQDVIPREFISNDFDIKNDVWREQFRVTPEIRKGEFRLFGAPRSLEEAHLQLQLVRALADKALNDSTPLDGKLGEVDLGRLVADAPGGFTRFAASMKTLGLNAADYEGFYAEGLQNLRHYVDSSSYQPYEKKMKRFVRTTNWKRAVKARSDANGLISKQRLWDPAKAREDALALKEEKDATKRHADSYRRTALGIRRGEPLGQSWREYDEKTVAQLKRLSWIDLKTKHPEIAVDYVYEKYYLSGRFDEAYRRMDEYRKEFPRYFNGQGRLESRISAMIANPRSGIEIDRLIFYTIEASKEAGDAKSESWMGITEILKRGNVAEKNRFFAKYFEQVPLPTRLNHIASPNFRKSLYGLPGGKYETAWGDYLARTIQPLKGWKGKFDVLQAVSTLVSGNDISFGPEEWKLLLALDREFRAEYVGLKKAGKLPNSVKKNLHEAVDLSRELNRRCTRLWTPAAA